MPAFLLYSYVSVSYLPSPMELSCKITIKVCKKNNIFHCWQYLTFLIKLMSGACVKYSVLTFNYIKIYRYLGPQRKPCIQAIFWPWPKYMYQGLYRTRYMILFDHYRLSLFILSSFSGLDLDKFIKFDPQVKC